MEYCDAIVANNAENFLNLNCRAGASHDCFSRAQLSVFLCWGLLRYAFPTWAMLRQFRAVVTAQVPFWRAQVPLSMAVCERVCGHLKHFFGSRAPACHVLRGHLGSYALC